MAHTTNTSGKNIEEPAIVPEPDQWYNLTLGSSFNDPPSTKFCTLRYEFKPASIDKHQPGLLHKNEENRVSVEFQNNQPGKPKVVFEGSSEDHKESDAVLFFDGETFRLERLHRAVQRLRHVRLPGESMASTVTPAASAGPASASCSSPAGKGTRFHSSNITTVPSLPVEVERIDVGDSESLGTPLTMIHPFSSDLNSATKSKPEKSADHPPPSELNPNPSSELNPMAAVSSPDVQNFDLEEALEAVDDGDDGEDGGAAQKGSDPENEVIDINLEQQAEIEDEIADVDASDEEPLEKGLNAAEELRAQVEDAEGREERTSSSSGSSGSESSPTSSSDSESSDSDSINSV